MPTTKQAFQGLYLCICVCVCVCVCMRVPCGGRNGPVGLIQNVCYSVIKQLQNKYESCPKH